MKILCIGAGYFAQFHLDAWQRLSQVHEIALCDTHESKASALSKRYRIASYYTDLQTALDQFQPDAIDIITPPSSHLSILESIVHLGRPIICQKPLAPTFDIALKIEQLIKNSNCRFMVHENFRFQPWHREIKKLIDHGAIGDHIYQVYFRSRQGDGWGREAYLENQPYYRDMPRLLVHETGVHFVDTFRYLLGEITSVAARLRRLNPLIRGEDAAIVYFEFQNRASAIWDANRYNETTAEDPRYTFGEMMVEGNGGTIRLRGDGSITIQTLGNPEIPHPYYHERRGFAGDCVYAAQKHFLDCISTDEPFETNIDEYMKTLRVQEAIYASHESHAAIDFRVNRGAASIASPEPVLTTAGSNVQSRSSQRRIIDLSLTIDTRLKGVEIVPIKTIDRDGWNSLQVNMPTHSGTHMDAPRHFNHDGAPIDDQNLSACLGFAKIVNLSPCQPNELITLQRFFNANVPIYSGDRVVLRTDWSKRFGDESYREKLPRISIELAEHLVSVGVSLVAIDAPSIADVENFEEWTAVHRTLFTNGILIVEGLCNLDQITQPTFEFIALPLKISNGDGSPVRAIAIE